MVKKPSCAFQVRGDIFFHCLRLSPVPCVYCKVTRIKWGVWLGRHTLDTKARVSKDQLSGDRNLGVKCKGKCWFDPFTYGMKWSRKRWPNDPQGFKKMDDEVSEKLPQG